MNPITTIDQAQTIVDLIEPMVRRGSAKPANIARLNEAKAFLGITEPKPHGIDDVEAFARAQSCLDSFYRTMLNPTLQQYNSLPSSKQIQKAKLRSLLSEYQIAAEMAREILQSKAPAASIEMQVKGILMEARQIK